jgi:hypothetical protein
MPRPQVSEIDRAIRRYQRKHADAPSFRSTRPRPAPVPASRPAEPVVLDAELDVARVGRLAAHPPEGTTPDELIERALQAAGVVGNWSGSREFRELWYLCVLAREAYLEQSHAGAAEPATSR